jgi:hypothetical protein
MNEHLITTDIEGHKILRIFEQFLIDENLPKYKDRIKVEGNPITGATQQAMVNWGTVGVISNVNSSTTAAWGNMITIGQNVSPPREFHPFAFLTPLRHWICKGLDKSKEKYADFKAESPLRIFEAIIGGGKQLQNLTARLGDYQKSIEYARSMGQVALAEKLETDLPIIQLEAILVSAGQVQYIDEKQLIDFILACQRGLKLDWVKNFTRLIPPEIQVKKLRFDELRTFDNYVVLHYDPANKSSALTKKDIEKKKDPILFGVLKGSRKLYHVGSWKDEFCDLTFSDLIAKYGKDVLTLK